VSGLDLIGRLEVHKSIQNKVKEAFMNCFLKKMFSYRKANIYYKIKRDKTKENTEYLTNQIDTKVESLIDYLHKCSVKSIEIKIEMGDIIEKEITQRKLIKLNKKKRKKVSNKNKGNGAYS